MYHHQIAYPWAPIFLRNIILLKLKKIVCSITHLMANQSWFLIFLEIFWIGMWNFSEERLLPLLQMSKSRNLTKVAHFFLALPKVLCMKLRKSPDFFIFNKGNFYQIMCDLSCISRLDLTMHWWFHHIEDNSLKVSLEIYERNK